MANIYTIFEKLTNGYTDITILFFSFTSVISAISVIISKNPIVSVLHLIALFLSIACYLISIGVSFIGLSYLLVYVGAVSILFLFILMLINIRISELASDTKNSIPLVFVIAIIYSYVFSPLLPNNYNKEVIVNYDNISFITPYYWENNIVHNNDISSIGNIMYTNFSIWLILVSLILALAMIGAIVITIKQKTYKT